MLPCFQCARQRQRFTAGEDESQCAALRDTQFDQLLKIGVDQFTRGKILNGLKVIEEYDDAPIDDLFQHKFDLLRWRQFGVARQCVELVLIGIGEQAAEIGDDALKGEARPDHIQTHDARQRL